MPFFESFWGHYLAQTVFYSLISVIIVETVMIIWKVTEPLLRIKFRLTALLLPVLCPAAYYPLRNGEYFREHIALLDLNRWLALNFDGDFALWHFFAAVLAVTTVVFIIQEIIPLARYHLGNHPPLPAIKKEQFPKLDDILANLSQSGTVPPPAVLLSPEITLMAYMSGHGALVLSETIIDTLDADELEAVIAHELAHNDRRVTRINRLLLVLRCWLFYNPVAILIFHRVINDNERLCDDIAGRLSGKRLSLASGLLKIFRHSVETAAVSGKRRFWHGISSLETTARQNLTRERIKRITQPDVVEGVPYPDLRVAVTGLVLAALLFFVV